MAINPPQNTSSLQTPCPMFSSLSEAVPKVLFVSVGALLWPPQCPDFGEEPEVTWRRIWPVRWERVRDGVFRNLPLRGTAFTTQPCRPGLIAMSCFGFCLPGAVLT